MDIYPALVYEERINKVFEFIEQNLEQPISLQSMAETACFSPYHFHRIFSAWVGETPVDYLRRIRLEKSALLLSFKKTLSITEIAMQCGFSSPAVFSRAFQSYFKTSPKSYRQKNLKQSVNTAIGNYIDPIKKFDPVMSHSILVKLEHFPAYTVIFARHLTGYNKGIGSAWGRLMHWAAAHNLLYNDVLTFGIPLDSPDVTPTGKCRYFACLVINPARKESMKLPGYLNFMEIPGGLYAVYHFEGMERNINNAYSDLYGKWLPSSGFEPADSPALEIYDRNNRYRSQGKFIFDIRLPIVAV